MQVRQAQIGRWEDKRDHIKASDFTVTCEERLLAERGCVGVRGESEAAILSGGARETLY